MSTKFAPLLAPVAALLTATTSLAHAPGVSLSGFGAPVIDGVLSPGEWDAAGMIEFPVNVPKVDGGGTVPGRLYVMNDEVNLYLAVEFPQTAIANSAAFEFDNDHSGGARANGDDILLINPNPVVGFKDEVRTTEPPCPPGVLCGFFDTTVGGSNDGEGAFSNAGGVTVYEFSHPLDSADDAHDFSLAVGDVVGFYVSIRLLSLGAFPDSVGDTYFPSTHPNLFGDITILGDADLEVAVDIKPGSEENCININGRGVIPVAILGSDGCCGMDPLDVRDIDPSSLRLENFAAALRGRGVLAAVEDVNRDRIDDLSVKFDDDGTPLVEGEHDAVLTGLLHGGERITGADYICVVGNGG